MKHIPDEQQLEKMLQDVSHIESSRLDLHLASAPWTRRAVVRLWIFRTALVAVGVLIVSLVLTPQGRAWAQGLLGFFATTPQETIETSPPMQAILPTTIVPVETIPATNIADPACEVSRYVCQLQMTQQELRFEIKVFSKSSVQAALNSDLEFISLASDPVTQSVSLAYSTPAGLKLWLNEGVGEFAVPTSPWGLVPESALQLTRVGDWPAEYLAGDFIQLPNAESPVWEPFVAGIQRLRWREDDRWYEIRSMGGSHGYSPLFLQADLIALAEKLVASSQSPDEVAGAGSATLDERAGIPVKEPSILPEGFRLCNRDYTAGYDGPTVFLIYCDDTGAVLDIQLVALPDAWAYDFDERWGPNVVVTSVKILSIDGYYAVQNDSVQILMWEADGVRTQIVYNWNRYNDNGRRIDLAGLLAIAESMVQP